MAKTTLMIATSQSITETDFAKFLEKVGGQGDSKDGQVMNDSGGQVWYYVRKKEDFDYEKKEIQEITKLLGQPPEVDVVLEISLKEQSSNELAWRFASIWESCWPSVIYDVGGLKRLNLVQKTEFLKF